MSKDGSVCVSEHIPLHVAHPTATGRKDRNKGEKSQSEGCSSLPKYHLLFPHSM